jgi:hypothetical protein
MEICVVFWLPVALFLNQDSICFWFKEFLVNSARCHSAVSNRVRKGLYGAA